MKKHNFNPGPSILPAEVFKKASDAILDYNGTGLSLLEISHRSPDFVEVMDRACALVKELLQVPDTHKVLFLQGGASTGFIISAYNFMKESGRGAYVNTGAWSAKAIKEAERLGTAEVIASSEDRNFTYIPKNYAIPEDADYLHITSNNTIFGTQIKSFPSSPIPMICDMSSDIFSRPIDISEFAMIYCGAQKNMGPAGVTMYIVDESMLGRSGRNIPSMLDLGVHVSKDSMFNTPPVFAIYASMLTLEYLKQRGGVEAIATQNAEKAKLIYEAIDGNPLFSGVAAEEDRSQMNATFTLTCDDLNDAFDEMWKSAGIIGLKGHRSVGGYRASMYNALPMESVRLLVETMGEFGKKYA